VAGPLVLAALLGAASPMAAPPAFATPQYALTFRTPAGASYCPLPENWTGSDHGVTLFLQRPTACGRTGYPSSGRPARPANRPRIEVFYGYYDADERKPPPCHAVGTMDLLGAPRPLCREDGRGGRVSLSVWSDYQADTRAELSLRLETTSQRLEADLAAFRALAASVRTCTAHWTGADKPFTIGHGAECPADARYF